GQWAVDVLGMRDGGPGFKIGTGSPILPAWRTWGRAGQPGHRGKDFGPGVVPEVGLELETEITVRRGSSGASVADLQHGLNALMGANLDVDGIFGSGTDAAVRRFQAVRGLGVDGVVGPLTWAALSGAGSPPTPTAPWTPPPTTPGT